MPPQGDQCIFCQLMANPEQLNIIAETDNFYVWHEYPEPRAKGQANVVPKEHTESILDLDPGQYQEAMTLVRKVMEKAKEAIDADGLTVVIPESETGGQMLDHMYIQIFPRFEEDENAGTPASALFPQIEMGEEEIKQTAQKMKGHEISFGEPKKAHPESQRFKEENSAEAGGKEKKQEASEDEDEEEEIEPEHEGKSFEWK
ncbi:MAG: HIT family protein [Candidatus Nanohalobium sp.]